MAAFAHVGITQMSDEYEFASPLIVRSNLNYYYNVSSLVPSIINSVKASSNKVISLKLINVVRNLFILLKRSGNNYSPLASTYIIE